MTLGSGGGGSGGGGTGRIPSEVGLSPEGLQAKRDFATRNAGEEPACVASQFESGVSIENIDYLLTNTVEVGAIPTIKGNTLAIRRCGRVGCSVDCAVIIDPLNNVTDAAQITASSHCQERR